MTLAFLCLQESGTARAQRADQDKRWRVETGLQHGEGQKGLPALLTESDRTKTRYQPKLAKNALSSLEKNQTN